jgi:hypothetical protein
MAAFPSELLPSNKSDHHHNISKGCYNNRSLHKYDNLDEQTAVEFELKKL